MSTLLIVRVRAYGAIYALGDGENIEWYWLDIVRSQKGHKASFCEGDLRTTQGLHYAKVLVKGQGTSRLHDYINCSRITEALRVKGQARYVSE
jgi:hypothetical protein